MPRAAIGRRTMAVTKLLLAAGLGLAGAMAATPAMAQQRTQPQQVAEVCVAPGDPQARETDHKILEVLLVRRDELSKGDAAKSKDALTFLDQQIVMVRARIAACTSAS